MNSSPASISGFNITELMIVVAIAGILATIALPSLSSLSQNQRVKSASFDLYALFTVARSEAIKRNADVTMAPVEVAGVFDRIDVTAADGTLIKSLQKPKGVDYTVLPSSTASVTYRRTGRISAGAEITFQIDVEGATTPTSHARCLSLSLSGMPSSRKGACP